MRFQDDKEKHLVTCLLNETKLILMIDSGADPWAIGHEPWNELWRINGENPAAFDRLKSASESTNLSAFAASQPLKVLLSFFVNLSILARNAAIALGVLQLGVSINSCEAFARPFPKAPGEQVHFHVDPLVVPMKNAYYNVPAAFRSQAWTVFGRLSANKSSDRLCGHQNGYRE